MPKSVKYDNFEELLSYRYVDYGVIRSFARYVAVAILEYKGVGTNEAAAAMAALHIGCRNTEEAREEVNKHKWREEWRVSKKWISSRSLCVKTMLGVTL